MALVGVLTIIVATALIGSLITFLAPEEAYACASDPFLGSICWFAGNFAIKNYAMCNGQLLAISSNTALFSILGTTYGGDGRTTFGLPDVRGRSLVHEGTGPGLDTIRLGQKGGSETTTLTVNNLPSHSHSVDIPATNTLGNANTPNTDKILSKTWPRMFSDQAQNTNLKSFDTGNTGSGILFDNRSPYLGLNCEIALAGLFPPRN